MYPIKPVVVATVVVVGGAGPLTKTFAKLDIGDSFVWSSSAMIPK
jgi:hypothetical protein